MKDEMKPIKSITFDKKAQNNLPQWVKDKMQKDRNRAFEERETLINEQGCKRQENERRNL